MGKADYYPPNVKTELPKKSRHKQILHIITYNTLSLRTNEKLIELMMALKNIKWSIIGMSEVRRLGENIEDYGEFILYYKGDTPGKYGIGFLIRKELKDHINEFIGISERIAILNIKPPSSEEMWSIVQVYSPTEQSDNTDIDSFYSTLTDAIKNYTSKNLIVMGDFNAQTGNKRYGEETALGPYSSGKWTRNGEKLIQLAYEFNLKILNSHYKKRSGNRWTWVSPDGKYKNEIDYILSNRITYFNDCRVINNLNFNSNHRALRAKLELKSSKRRPFKARPKNKDMLLGTKLKENLKDFIENTKELNTQVKYNKLLESLTATTETPGVRDKRLTWLSEKTRNLLEERAKLISQSNKTKNIRRSITQISKEINLSIRKDREKHRLERLENCIQKTGGAKKALKQLTEKRDWIPKMKSKSGKYLTQRPDINTLATNFFKNLYTNQCNIHPTDLEGEDTVPEIMLTEVEKAITSQKKDKAPGSDNITNEYLIANKDIITPILTYIFEDVIESELIPEQWTSSTIILLHKKGSKDDINNYRPISLITNIYKVFAKVILNRISKVLDENQPREQAGFRSGYSTLDHIYVVKQILEKSREYNTTFYCCFVDYSKAFDTLEHEAIWKALKNQGVEKKYIRMLRNIYTNSKAKIRLEKEGKEIKLGRGVRQGDPVSPKLFTAVLEEIFRQLDWEKNGITINGEKLSHLRFADDIIIFSQTKEDLEGMINDLDRESRKVGLNMNTEKTKVMTNGTEEPIYILGNAIEYVDEYIYLGQIISLKDLTSKEVERRIGNAWKRFWSLREIFKNKETSMAIKRKLFNICIVPVLTYGCQTWSLTKAQTKKLETCQNAMNRSMMGKKLSDKMRTTTIKKYTKTNNVTVIIKKLKWKWAGHTVRGQEKWSKTLMNWYTGYMKRKRGRPFQRWVDEIKAVAGNTWTRKARDRQMWRQLEEAFA